MAHRTLEAGGVIVVAQRLNPSIARFDREAATETFRSEQLVPISLAVWQTVFEIERVVSEWPSAVSARETLRMPGTIDCVEAVALDPLVTFRTHRRHVVLETAFAVQEIVLFNEAAVHQIPTTRSVGADEM